MKKIFTTFVLYFLISANAHSELTIKIDRAEIGALPIMVKISKVILPNISLNIIKEIIENDLIWKWLFQLF